MLESTAPDGYSGNIQLLVAADFNRTVLGSRVTEHKETPGLGDKIDTRISDWITSLSGKHIESADDPHWAVKKTAGILISSPVPPSRRAQSSMLSVQQRIICRHCRRC